VTVEPEQSVEVRLQFQRTLPLREGLFVLELPAVSAEKLAGVRQRDEALSGGAVQSVVVGLTVTVHHEDPLPVAESRSHELVVSYTGNRSVIDIIDGEGLGDRDFDLRFSIGPEDDPTLLGYVGAEQEGVHEVMAVLTPPARRRDDSVRPKRMLFVLDTSGSMAKGKLDQAREALYASLQQLGGEDTFNVVEFDGEHSLMQPEPVAASTEALQQAASWLQKQRPGGSTKLLPALLAAFEQPLDQERHGMIVVLTDGNVQDGRQVDELLQQKLGQARLFFVGIGEDLHRENLLRFAEIGRGTAAFAADADGIGGAVAVLFDSISEPLAWDLEVDWGGADVELVKPRKLPDLYAGRPVTVFARVRGELPTELKLHGTTMEGLRTFSVVLPSEGLEALPRVEPSDER